MRTTNTANPRARVPAISLLTYTCFVCVVSACAIDEEDSALVGYWYEAGRVDCVTGDIIEPAPTPIEELKIEPGTLFVTWSPFEVGYFDYQADYRAELERGSIELERIIPWGIDPPADLDAVGSLSLSADGKTLTLTDFWFGTPPVNDPQTNYPLRCGHMLTRAGPARTGR